jgi:hypothetical protein
MPTKLRDGGATFTADEYAVVVEALELAMALVLDMEADANTKDADLAEVRLLRLLEWLMAMGLRA